LRVLPVTGGPLRKLEEDAWGAVPSPDGRYLAFGEVTLDSNAWVIENFR